MADWYLPAGSTADGPWAVSVTPSRSGGLAYASLRVLELGPGAAQVFETREEEVIVLPLAGGCEVTSGLHRFVLRGRSSVFDAVSDFCYLPRDATATVSSAGGGRFALCGAPATRDLPARYQPAPAVEVELRGAGVCSRQVNNVAAAGGAFECAKLIVVEVLTPEGNWSSYPPHKHDERRADETPLEEIYYFEVAGGGVGFQRVYASRPERPIDVFAEVRTGDTVLVPHGWHGPSMAAPGYHLYYLNVMAGPDDERAWRFRDDPAHAWVRDTWVDLPLDPRLPLTSAVEATR
jgi:5-deoxy-glucuronate isomerase